jgi:mono/diheme cytochrome c family protein
MRTLIPALGLLALTGCEIPSEFFQRMEVQAKYEYYEPSEFWADGRSMREPPQGTIPREAKVGNPGLTTGRINGALVATIPMQVDKNLLLLGQKKYSIVCAQCHGVLGDGNSIVAENMGLRLPPSLLELANRPAGHFYTAINEGFGVMPSFSGELNTQERWAVVAYVRALQASRGAQAGAQQPLPPQENR